jgi:hypothetical protein
LYGKFYNKRPVATGLDRFFLRCGPIRTGPKRSSYGPLISESVYTGCGCQLPRFEVKNRTRLDFKTLVLWSSPLRSQHSATPPTARPNDNHPAVIRYSAAKPGQKTSQLTITDGRRTIEDPSPTHGSIECWKHSETSVHQSFLRWVRHDCTLLMIT